MIALGLLIASALLSGVVLIDEAWASYAAHGELRRSAELAPRHLRAARAVLRAAFATYLATYAVPALLLTQWHLVEQATGGGLLGGGSQLTAAGWIVAAAATAIFVLELVWSLGGIARLRLAIGVAWVIAMIALIPTVWDLRADPCGRGA